MSSYTNKSIQDTAWLFVFSKSLTFTHYFIKTYPSSFTFLVFMSVGIACSRRSERVLDRKKDSTLASVSLSITILNHSKNLSRILSPIIDNSKV